MFELIAERSLLMDQGSVLCVDLLGLSVLHQSFAFAHAG
jgi:hypothetical protein